MTRIKGISRIFRVFTVINPEEMVTALLLTLNVYLLLLAYYIIKPIRDALILAGEGPEVKIYLSSAQAILFIIGVKIFSGLSSKVPRQILITIVTLFFISNLALFYVINLLGAPLGTMGIIFFIWAGIFNVMVIAQFWAFANDIYSQEAGKRIFPFIAFGATFGAFSGSKIAELMVGTLGLYKMMLVAGGVLGICILLTLIIHKREVKQIEQNHGDACLLDGLDKEECQRPLKGGGGFRLIFKSKYLLYIALLIILLNFVNTSGEYILGKIVITRAAEAVANGSAGGLDVGQYIGKFYANYFFYVNLFAMIIQLFFVSRIFNWVGVRGALLFLPLIVLGAYSFVAMGASLILVRWTKVLENSTDYSLMNTTRHSLFLITTREEKYKAKATIDTFFVRTGDVLSASIVLLGTTYFNFSIEKFAKSNVIVAIIWIILCLFIIQEHKKISAKRFSNEPK
jgi:ATP:ADP antiporter, AAA family